MLPSNPSGQADAPVPPPASPAGAERPPIPGTMRAAGIIEIVLGGLSALYALFWVVVSIATSGRPYDPNSPYGNISGVSFLLAIILGVPGVLGVVLGIATLRMRRWAVIAYLVVSVVIGMWMIISQVHNGVLDRIAGGFIVLAIVLIGINALTLPHLRHTI